MGAGTLPRVAAVCLALGMGSCALLTTRSGPAAGFTPYADRPVVGTGLRDWKGAVHVHSFLSHDSRGTIPEIAAAAEACGLDFLIMTDHQTPHSVSRGTRGMIGRTLFLVGAEIRTPQGTLLAFPLRHFVRPGATLAETVADVHAQGGLAFAGHAEREFAWDEPALDGVEIVNLHAAAKDAPVGSLAFHTMFTPMRTMLSLLAMRPDLVLGRWDQRLGVGLPATPVGGNDAHANVSALFATIGTYEEIFGVLSTHVLAPELSEAAIVEALRAGRTYVAFDLHRDATGFDFRARNRDGDHLPGSELTSSAELELRVTVPAAATIHLLHEGRRVRAGEGLTLELRDPPPGVWRVEVELSSARPWIYSSWIRVLPR